MVFFFRVELLRVAYPFPRRAPLSSLSATLPRSLPDLSTMAQQPLDINNLLDDDSDDDGGGEKEDFDDADRRVDSSKFQSSSLSSLRLLTRSLTPHIHARTRARIQPVNVADASAFAAQLQSSLVGAGGATDVVAAAPPPPPALLLLPASLRLPFFSREGNTSSSRSQHTRRR